MRKVFLVVSLFCCLLSFSQENENKGEHVYSSVELEAEPPGGIVKFREFIAKKFKIPEHLPVGYTGKVVTRFVVSADGKIGKIEIVSSSDESLSAEAIRVLSNSGDWKPAEFNGKKVNCFRVLPLAIRKSK